MKKFIKQVNDFYPTYLMDHQNPWNKLLHVIGNIVIVSMAVGVITVAALTGRWWGLFLLPYLLTYSIYVFAWPGHFFFEKNKPATFHVSRWITKACDWKMMFQLMTGKLKLDTRQRMDPRLIEMATQTIPASHLRNVGHIILPENEVKTTKTWGLK